MWILTVKKVKLLAPLIGKVEVIPQSKAATDPAGDSGAGSKKFPSPKHRASISFLRANPDGGAIQILLC